MNELCVVFLKEIKELHINSDWFRTWSFCVLKVIFLKINFYLFISNYFLNIFK